MRYDTKEIEEKASEVYSEKEETNLEATRRIGEELRAATKLEERRNAVMNMYFEITGFPMTNAEFEIYNAIFEKADKGYTIRSFIEDKKRGYDEEKMRDDSQDIDLEKDDNNTQQD